MWFATAAGISIYDGLSWNNLSKKDGLPNIAYRKIYKDEKGTIWTIPMYMCEKLVYFENDSLKIIKLPETRNENGDYSVTSLCVLYENNRPVVYVGTFNGIYIYRDEIWKNITTADGLPDNMIYSLTFYNNKFYIATLKGISVLSSGKIDNSIQKLFGEKSTGTLLFSVDKSNPTSQKLWFVGKSRLGYLENNSINIVTENFLLPDGFDFEYPSLCFGDNNLVYFGNFFFTYYYNKSTGEIFPLTHNHGLKSDGGTSIYIDSEGNVWKTGTRGIDKLNNLYLVNYNTNLGLQEDEVSSIFEYKPGKMILGHNNGITFFSREEIKTIAFPDKNVKYPGNVRILDICADRDGTFWLAGSTSGLGKMNSSGNIMWIKIPDNNYISSVASDKKGNIWATTENGVFIKNGNTFTEPPNFKVKKQFYRKSFFFDDEIYFASSTVLVRVKNNEVKYLKNTGNNSANDIFSLYKDSEGKVLIGTKDGLYQVVDDGFVKFDVNGFKINNPVYSILQDKRGVYWFGTNDGVVEWDGKNKPRNFMKANGLSGTEINRSAFCLDKSGKIWVGTESGLSCFRPEYNNTKIPVPKVVLFFAEDPLGEKHSLVNAIKIKSDIKSLFFNFRGISYYNEQFMRYKLKLEGFDADWYEVTQHNIDKIRYTNLKPGEYKFLVSAKNITGEWSEVYSSAVITIEKPFYRKWWFILLFIGFVGFFLYFIYRLYLTRVYYINLENKVQIRTAKLKETEIELRNAQAFLEEKVKERTEKLGIANEQLKELNASKDKFFSIIAHDLKSPFVGLIGYSELLKNEANEMTKDKIIEYADNLHKNIKNTYNLLENLLNWALLQTHRMVFNPRRIDLYLEIKAICEMFDVNSKTKNIELVNEVNINTSLDADKNMLRTILYNLISNAIKYTNPGGRVRIYSRYNNDNIEIFVSDNGIGMEKSVLDKLFKLNSNISTKGTAKEKGTGLGLILINEMVEMHSGKIRVESEAEKGTTFCIILPKELE